MRRDTGLRLALPFFALLLVAAQDPSDVVAYSDDVPITAHGGGALPNPFVDGPHLEIPTRIRMAGVGDIGLPRGAQPWSHATWSKYVLVGNYDEEGKGVFQNVEDQAIGVYDTETRTFCQLDLDPLHDRNASVQWLQVASPGQAQTRIYFTGFAADADGYSLGYVEADAANPAPCDPETGWNVVGFTREQLRCRAVEPNPLALSCSAEDRHALAEADDPCRILCGFDDMQLLDADTIMIGNWSEFRLIVVKFDGSGSFDVQDVYEMPLWQPDHGNPQNACYDLRPVSNGAVDPTRSAGDQRWMSSFDVLCSPVFTGQTGCPSEGVCPLDTPSLACPESGPCVNSYCEIPHPIGYAPCAEDSDCRLLDLNLGACVDHCAPVGITTRCEGGSRDGEVCAIGPPFNTDCPGGACLCAAPPPFIWPSQEFSFDDDPASITPKSRLFGPSSTEFGIRLTYDGSGNHWMLGWPPGGNPGQALLHTYYNAGGTHTYDEDGDPTGVEVVAPATNPPVAGEATLAVSDWNLFQGTSLREVPGALYAASSHHLQKLFSFAGAWHKDTGFKLWLGANHLPTQARACGGSGPQGCVSDDECTAPSTCLPATTTLGATHKVISTFGGSPPSLWMLSGFTSSGSTLRFAKNNLFLLRVPVNAGIPDSAVGDRPAVAWNGGDCASDPKQCRVWAAAMKGGSMKFRVRDDGFWSDWHALPAGSVSMGPGIIATGSAVEIFARGADRTVKQTKLTSSITCAPASCTWSTWESIPNTPLTDHGVAAAWNGTKKLIAIRRAYDAKVHVVLGDMGTPNGWSPWTALDGITTGQAPSATYHGDGKFWVAASQAITKTIHVNHYDETSGAGSWTEPGDGDPPAAAPFSLWVPASHTAAWLTAPAIASDGARLHVYDGAQISGSLGTWFSLFHKLDDGTGWGDWRPFRTGALSGLQPAATNVNGEVLVVNSWPSLAMWELGSD